jgi:hypothetical protein
MRKGLDQGGAPAERPPGPPHLPRTARRLAHHRGVRVAVHVDVRSSLASRQPRPVAQPLPRPTPPERRGRADRHHEGPQRGVGGDLGNEPVEVVLVGVRALRPGIAPLAPERGMREEEHGAPPVVRRLRRRSALCRLPRGGARLERVEVAGKRRTARAQPPAPARGAPRAVEEHTARGAEPEKERRLRGRQADRLHLIGLLGVEQAVQRLDQPHVAWRLGGVVQVQLREPPERDALPRQELPEARSVHERVTTPLLGPRHRRLVHRVARLLVEPFLGRVEHDLRLAGPRRCLRGGGADDQAPHAPARRTPTAAW